MERFFVSETRALSSVPGGEFDLPLPSSSTQPTLRSHSIATNSRPTPLQIPPPISPPVIVCKSISIRGYRTCLFLMSSLIAARTIPLARYISGRFTAGGGFVPCIEAGGGVWRRPLNRDTHSGRKSLWILCKGQLFRSTNDRSMHSKSARITTHRYFFCTLQPMDSIRIALCSSTIVFVCLCLCARACLVFLRPAAIYRFFLFPLSPSSLRFHRTTVVKIYAKSSSLPYIRR